MRLRFIDIAYCTSFACMLLLFVILTLLCVAGLVSFGFRFEVLLITLLLIIGAY